MNLVQENCINYLEFRKEEYKNKSNMFKEEIENLKSQLRLIKKQIRKVEKRMEKEVIELPKEERRILEELSKLGEENDCFIFPYDNYGFADAEYFSKEFLDQFEKFKPYINIKDIDLKIGMNGKKKGHKSSESILKNVLYVEVDSDIEEDYPDYGIYNNEELKSIISPISLKNPMVDKIDFGDHDEERVFGSVLFPGSIITITEN